MIAARKVLRRADSLGSHGDESAGFLSEQFGLLPRNPPLRSLPDAFAVWDRIAAELPNLYRDLGLRAEIEQMPVLSADRNSLPDQYVWRACTLLGMLAHAYVRVMPQVHADVPAAIDRPWAQLCERLNRTATALTYDDLICYNWRCRDPSKPEHRDLDDLELLFPTVGNNEERVFYLAQVEVLHRGTPMIGAMVRAQEAVHARDTSGLIRELVTLCDALERCGQGTFAKIDANPYSPTHVDPVVWAKTVAPFAVAIREGSHAISGAAAPLFQALDVFIGRERYDSRVGREARRLRSGFSPHFRSFLDALAEVSVGQFVHECDSDALKGLWHGLLAAYAGEQGFLAVHRKKAFAFLELAFKVGRSVTTGGFTGLFEDQTWEVANSELDLSRLERPTGLAGWCPVARRASDDRSDAPEAELTRLRLDLSQSGLRYRPGDRLAILPRNDPALVARTLDALRATGDEPVRLDGRWREAVAMRGQSPATCTLRELLTLGCLRPLTRQTAKALAAVSGSENLSAIVQARREGEWELWDVLLLLAQGGFDTRQLWRAEPWEPHSIGKLVRPERARFYSAASAPENDSATAPHIDLMVAPVDYVTRGTDGAVARHGTASRFVQRLAAGLETDETVPVHIIPAARFRLPDDARQPIVMFAAGVGIAPFQAFVAARHRDARPGPAWLFLSSRNSRQLEAWAAEVAAFTWLRVIPVLTHGAGARQAHSGIGGAMAAAAATLKESLDNGRTVFYVCGSPAFSAAVIDRLQDIADDGVLAVRRLIGERRLCQDVFTSGHDVAAQARFLDASEVVLHNDEGNGYWTVIDGAVYDITEFAHRHPGGLAIMYESAGRDATSAFAAVGHDQDREIEAMLGMYSIGRIRRLDFGHAYTVAVGERGLEFVMVGDVFRAWVNALYRVVEVENAVRHDFGILDKVTVAGEHAGGMSVLKAQLMLEAQSRFLDVYVPTLVGPLGDLWARTAGLCDPEQDAATLRTRLAAIITADRARDQIRRIGRQLHELGWLASVEPAVRRETLDRLITQRHGLQHADLAFVASLKLALRTGVRTFEVHQRAIPGTGRALLDELDALPPHLVALHDAVDGLI